MVLIVCGRFTQISDAEFFAALLQAEISQWLMPRYNVAPTDEVLAVKVTPWGERVLVPMQWGLIPHWSKGPDRRFSMINARRETLAEKPAFRDPFHHRRCLIPADGFYEWRQQGSGKQPYYIRRRDEQPLVFAGLWDHWDDPKGGHVDSCTIITTEADERIRPIHERMPLLLEPSVWRQWLDPKLEQRDAVEALMASIDGTPLHYYPISRKVNNPLNDGAELLRPLEA